MKNIIGVCVIWTKTNKRTGEVTSNPVQRYLFKPNSNSYEGFHYAHALLQSLDFNYKHSYVTFPLVQGE